MSDNTPPNASSALTTETETGFKVWMCILCGFLYNEADGMPDQGIAAGTRWEHVPEDWICPECSATKVDFEMVEI